MSFYVLKTISPEESSEIIFYVTGRHVKITNCTLSLLVFFSCQWVCGTWSFKLPATSFAFLGLTAKKHLNVTLIGATQGKRKFKKFKKNRGWQPSNEPAHVSPRLWNGNFSVSVSLCVFIIPRWLVRFLFVLMFYSFLCVLFLFFA